MSSAHCNHKDSEPQAPRLAITGQYLCLCAHTIQVLTIFSSWLPPPRVALEIFTRLRSFGDEAVDYFSDYVQFYNEPLVVEFGPFFLSCLQILEGVPKP